MKTFTVIIYQVVCREWYGIQAENKEEAIARITDDAERPDPDNVHVLKNTDYEVEEEVLR